DDVGVDVGARIFGAVADARLRREMDDDLGLRLGHLLGGELRVLEHHFPRREACKLRESLMTPPLEGKVVIRREAVESDDGVALGEETLRQVESDEASGPGNEEAHTGAVSFR